MLLGTRPTILIVNDYAPTLFALESMLAGLAVDIVTANRGEEALAYLQQEEVAAVLLDVNMPGMSGFAVAEAVRQLPGGNALPILFITAAHPADADQRRGYALGAVDYLISPVQPVILRAKVAMFVELYQQRHRSEAQAQLLAQAQRLAQLGSWEWRPASDTLTWSPEVYRLTGLPPDQAAPRKVQQAALYHPEGWAQWRAGFKRLLAGEAFYETELEVLRADGGVRWVLARGEAERDAAGRLLKVHGTVLDITARQQAEAAARRLAAEVLDLYQNAPCGYHSLDADGRFVRINDTELRWLGYTREEMLGQYLADFLSPAGQRAFLEKFAGLKQGGGLRDVEYAMIRKDGSQLPVLVNASALFDGQGRFVMSRATVSDLTEQKMQAAEQKRQEQRRAELAHRLIEVQEEERRRLALDVHDVVSPNLATLQINLGLVEAGLPLQTHKHLAPRLNDIRQLLRDTHSHLRGICANLRPSVLDYAGLYATVENYARDFAVQTGIAVEVKGTAGDARLSPDKETLLFRIATEALTNCAKHAKANNVTIELSHDQANAHLDIADDGIGFDPAELSAPGRTPGLGLLTMGERAEFAGGRFQLNSRPGQGTRITVEI